MEKEELTHKNSLALKCFKIIFTIYFAFNLIITGLQIAADFTSAKGDVVKDINQFQHLIKDAMAEALYAEDEENRDIIVSSILDSNIISGVRILSPEDELLAEKPKNADKKEFFGLDYPLMKKTDSGPELVGHLKIYYSNMAAVERVKMHVFILIIFALVKSLILFTIFLWVFKKSL